MKPDQTNTTIRRYLLSASFSLFLALLTAPVNAAVRYASTAGVQSGLCTTWGTACDLQYAIGVASSGDELWVKGGTYRPTFGTDRSISFVLKNGVALYGGFVGIEAALVERNPQLYVTILSGDIGVAGTASDNSYHVVSAAGVDRTALLDGFVVSGGTADGTGSAANGGGILISAASPTLRNLTITDNSAGLDGGGIYLSSGSPVLANVAFSYNSAWLQGGGMYSLSGKPVLANVTFSNNSAGLEGGGLYTLLNAAQLTNVVMTGNSAPLDGNALYGLCTPACVGALCRYTVPGDADTVTPLTLASYTVSASSGPNGTILPAVETTLMSGTTTTFTILPNSGYHEIVPVGGSCGGSYTGNPYDTVNGISYTIAAVTADCTVQAQFSPFICGPRPAGLISWWKGDGNANDHIGGHTGTPTAVTYAPGKVGQAFSIPGAGSYITIDAGTDGSAFDFTGKPFTIAAWFRVDNQFTGQMGYGSIFDRIQPGTGVGYRLDYSPWSGNFRLLGSTSLEASAAINQESWNHVVAVSNGSSSAIYLNGVQIGATGSHEIVNYPVAPRIGECQDVGVAPFNGVIDEIQVYDRALTSSEVQDVFNDGSKGVCVPLTLLVGISGNGSVTSHNQSVTNYTCASPSCTPVSFSEGDTVSLAATGSNSTFSSWSGDLTGSDNPGSITMNNDKAVTATFTPDPAKVKIDGDTTTLYYAIGATLNTPAVDATLRARDLTFDETITVTNSHKLRLRGGFPDSNFSDGSQTGYSTISGWLKIQTGKLTAERVKIKRP